MGIKEELEQQLKSNSGNPHLERLSSYLNYELSSSTFYLLSFFYFPLLFIATLAAVVFTPYMLYVLWIERRKGWLLGFVLFIIIPIILLTIISIDPLFKKILIYIPMANFFLYCITLKYSVNDWTRERRWQRIWETEQSNNKQKDFHFN